MVWKKERGISPVFVSIHSAYAAKGRVGSLFYNLLADVGPSFCVLQRCICQAVPTFLGRPRKHLVEGDGAGMGAVQRAGTQTRIDTVDDHGPVRPGVQLAQPQQVQELASIVAVHAALFEGFGVVHTVEDIGRLALVKFGPKMNLGGDDGPEEIEEEDSQFTCQYQNRRFRDWESRVWLTDIFVGEPRAWAVRCSGSSRARESSAVPRWLTWT